MSEITICSHDNELLREIEGIKIAEVEFGYMLLDDATSPDNLIAYIELASSLISLLVVMLPIIAKSRNDAARKTNVYIRTTEVTVDLKNLVATYKEDIHIEIIQLVKR